MVDGNKDLEKKTLIAGGGKRREKQGCFSVKARIGNVAACLKASITG